VADFIKDPDVENIGHMLIKAWGSLLGHIEPDKILWVRDIGPINPRGSKKAGSCIRIRPPYNLLDPDVFYIIAVHARAKWDEMDNNKRAALIMHELLHIPEEFGEGALIDHDIKDFKILVDTFGSDYLIREDLPDLLAGEGDIS